MYYFEQMAESPKVLFRVMDEVLLVGRMAVYASQVEAAQRIPSQWQEFRSDNPAVGDNAVFYGASPCTDDQKLHYLTGIATEGEDGLITGERLMLVAAEYAVVPVDDATLLRETWRWLLGSWLPASGRRERNAPEFERFTGVSETGVLLEPIEIGIPLEPVDKS